MALKNATMAPGRAAMGLPSVPVRRHAKIICAGPCPPRALIKSGYEPGEHRRAKLSKYLCVAAKRNIELAGRILVNTTAERRAEDHSSRRADIVKIPTQVG